MLQGKLKRTDGDRNEGAESFKGYSSQRNEVVLPGKVMFFVSHLDPNNFFVQNWGIDAGSIGF